MPSPRAVLVAGLAFGDEAKGATVDFLCRKLPVDLVVRYNGGSQAAHNVVTPEGIHHCFSQFGAGMLADSRVRTHLSRFMLVDPLTMMNEAESLIQKIYTLHGDAPEHVQLSPWSRTTVDPRCVIITPFHKRLNRLREQVRGSNRHGSCGMGVGVAREWSLKYGEDVLYAEDLLDFTKTVGKLRFLRDLLEQEMSAGSSLYDDFSLYGTATKYMKWPVTLRDTLPDSEFSVFEGAQGVLLDETHGEEPYRTWTDCTFNNALTLCGEVGIKDIMKIGCLRSYYTRHGAGPFPTECMRGVYPPDAHNVDGEWQGSFRTGDFDYHLAKKALRIVGGVDYLAISHLDFGLDERVQSVKELEETLDSKVGITAHGPTANDRRFTEAWNG